MLLILFSFAWHSFAELLRLRLYVCFREALSINLGALLLGIDVVEPNLLYVYEDLHQYYSATHWGRNFVNKILFCT